MLKIFSASQIKELDGCTISSEPIASIDLMERACHAFVSWFVQHFNKTLQVGIVCGTGNNGGDGLGIARLLQTHGYALAVWVIRGSAPESVDFKINLERLKSVASVQEIAAVPNEHVFAGYDILIDAIFGSGLSRPTEGVYARVIELFNKSKSIRVSVDVPSGLMMDKPSSGEVVCAHHTVSFQLPKLAFFLPHNYPFVGQWQLVNIGLSKPAIKDMPANRYLLERKDIKKILRNKARAKFNHKGNFGHALLVAGSVGKIGAAVLGAKAALRSGIGLLTVHIPRCGYPIVQSSVPEAMASVDPSEEQFTTIPLLSSFTVVGVGPGIGVDIQTVKALRDLLQAVTVPVVLDADAINILGNYRELIQLLPQNSILTPHPKEFERLVGQWSNDFERLEKQREFSIRTQTFIILKGAYSSITSPNGTVYFNQTGNPGMATAGSGDVLTGIVTGMLGRGYSPEQAALAGTWIHGLSGDIAVGELGEESLIASDIIDHLPQAFTSFR